MIRGYNGQPSASKEVGWLDLLTSALVNNSVWATKWCQCVYSFHPS
jgi:hypothetical protein